MTDIRALTDAGVSVWLDDLGRHRIASGELAELVNEVGIRGVTTNPSIFAAAVKSGSEYQADLQSSQQDAEGTLHDLMVRDVQDACTVFSDLYERSGALDGRVSLEVDPRLALDTARTVEAAAQSWADVDRPNVMVKIPATQAGLSAITDTLAAGISVNVTLIFAIDRYRQVQQAWLAGMEQAKANGHDLSKIASVASFFVSRMDTAVDRRLDELLANKAIEPDRHEALRGRAAVANARNAYRAFTAARREPAWQALEAAGAHPQRPLWASTSTKDPSFSPTRYVDELIAPDTVNTMPSATLEAVLKSPADPGTQTFADDPEAMKADSELFDELAAVGIKYDEVITELEQAGVQSFTEAWQTLLGLVSSAKQKAAG
ncbi:MAG: transaldolase [Actinomycetes bacterium]